MVRSALAAALLALLSACAVPPPVVLESSRTHVSPSIPIRIERPDGPGPFPAIVILHDCSGLGPRSSGAPARWAAEFVKRGYVVAIPDSFTTRGFPNGVCIDPSPMRNLVAPLQRVADAD